MSSESQQSKGIEVDEERQGRGPTQKAELMMGQDFTFMMGGIQGHGGRERPLCWSYGGFTAGSRRLVERLQWTEEDRSWAGAM